MAIDTEVTVTAAETTVVAKNDVIVTVPTLTVAMVVGHVVGHVDGSVVGIGVIGVVGSGVITVGTGVLPFVGAGGNREVVGKDPVGNGVRECVVRL